MKYNKQKLLESAQRKHLLMIVEGFTFANPVKDFIIGYIYSWLEAIKQKNNIDKNPDQKDCCGDHSISMMTRRKQPRLSRWA